MVQHLSLLFLHLYLFMNFIKLRSQASNIATKTLQYNMLEGQTRGLLVGNIKRDCRELFKKYRNEGIHLHFMLSKPDPSLQIDEQRGILTTKFSVDLEELCKSREECPKGTGLLSTIIDIRVMDDAANMHVVGIITVNIIVEDVNDFGPQFGISGIFEKSILEIQCVHVPNNCLLNEFALPIARDADFSTKYNTLTYTLNHTFILDRTFALKIINDEPYMELLQGLDYETTKEYEFVLTAKDAQNKSASIDVKITILDFNDNVPTFSKSVYETTVSESVDIGTEIFKLSASDKDVVSQQFKFKILDARKTEFSIDNTGAVKTVMKLDFEHIKRYEIPVQVADGLYTNTAKLIVKVEDANDNAPEWRSPGILSISENTPSTIISVTSVWDKDFGINGKVICPDVEDKRWSTSGLSFRKREGDTNDFDLKSTREFDREHEPFVTAYLVCYDQGSPSLTSTLSQVVQIIDRNDNAPQFIKNVFQVNIKENLAAGVSLTQVTATDADANANGKLNFQILPSTFHNIFAIDNITGLITVLESLDREMRSSYHLQVLAVDGGKPHALTGTAFVNITVLDENDNSPRFVDKQNFHIPEHHTVPFVIGKIEALDPDADENGQVYFEQLFGSYRSKFRVSPNGTIVAVEQFDREALEDHNERVYVSVCVMDLGFGKSQCGSSGTMFASKNFSIIVDDINDNEPRFVQPTNFSIQLVISINTHTEGDTVIKVKAEDRDIYDNGRIRYSLELSENIFIIDSQTGLITLARKLTKYDIKLYSIIVIAKDYGERSRSSSNVLRILITEASAENGLTPEKVAEMQTRRNITVIVVLASISGVLALLLIMAIACVNQSCCRRRRRRGHGSLRIHKYLTTYQENNKINDDMDIDAVEDGVDLMMRKWPLPSGGVQCYKIPPLSTTQNMAAATFVDLQNSSATFAALNDTKSSMCVDKSALGACELRHFNTLGKRVNTSLSNSNPANATTSRIEKPTSSDQVKFWLYQIQEDAQVGCGTYNGPPCGADVRCQAGSEQADSVLSDSGRGCSEEDLYVTHSIGSNRGQMSMPLNYQPIHVCSMTHERNCDDYVMNTKRYSTCQHFGTSAEPTYVSSLRSAASFTMLDENRLPQQLPNQQTQAPQQRTPATLRRLRAAIGTPPPPAGLMDVHSAT